jgi:hypothetical protein
MTNISMRQNNKGFGILGTLLAVLIVVLIVVAGISIDHHDHKQKTVSNSNSTHSKSKFQLGKNSTTSVQPKAVTTTTLPLLGESWAPSQQGYGSVKPSTINNGGDPTGIVTNVTWNSWGGTQAIGQGTSTYVSGSEDVADGTQAQATVVAFNLSTCQGKAAYTAIEWYYPQYGGSFDSSHYRNICNGQEVGNS